MTLHWAALTNAQRLEYNKALSGNSMCATQVTMLTLSHGFVADISSMFIDGQVNVNNSDGATKVLSCGFRDPGHQLRLDASSPAAGVNSLDRLLRVTVLTYVRSLSAWVGVDAITCRPTTVERNGENVTVEAQSKESLHLRNVPSYTLRKGSNVVTAIRTILSRSGETRFHFPANKTKRLPRDVHVGGSDADRQPWLVARRLAKSIGLQLYYDGTGYACMRVAPGSPAWYVVDQDNGTGGSIGPNIKGPPTINADLSAIRNRIVVTYHTPSTKKKKSESLSVVEVADPRHPFSAQSLVTNGVAWWSTEFYDQPDIHSEKDARAFAKARLTEKLQEAVAIKAEIIPVWHLNPLDLLRVQDRSATFDVRFNEGSIPLGPSDGNFMSLGYQKYVRRPTAGLIRRR